MKLKRSLALVICSLSAAPAAPAAFAAGECSSGEAAVYAAAQGQAQSGAISTNDVLGLARLNLLDAQLACGEIKQAAYCKDATAAAQAHLDVISSRMSLGETDLTDIMAAQKLAREVKASCK